MAIKNRSLIVIEYLVRFFILETPLSMSVKIFLIGAKIGSVVTPHLSVPDFDRVQEL